MCRLNTLAPIYFMCGMMDVMVGGLRAMGNAVTPMLVSIVCACGLRGVWIYVVFAAYPVLEVIFWSYPVTWIITITAHTITYLITKRKVVRQLEAQLEEAQA